MLPADILFKYAASGLKYAGSGNWQKKYAVSGKSMVVTRTTQCCDSLFFIY